MSESPFPYLRAMLMLIRPPLFVIGWIVKAAYEGLLGPLERRSVALAARRFGDEIADSFGFLIERYGAVVTPIVPRREIAAFDYVEAILETDLLRIRVTRCRGAFRAFVAPAFDAKEEADLFDLLAVCDGRPVMGGAFRDCWDVAARLESRMEFLLEWYSRERYPELKRRLQSSGGWWTR